MSTTAMAELLQWHATADTLPDADTTVLMWVKYATDCDWTAGWWDWTAGWWDGEAWRYCESGGVVAGDVTHWAEPEGPTC